MAYRGYDPLPDDYYYDKNTPGPPDDDDDNADQTGAFVPFSSSTPVPDEFQTAQKEKEPIFTDLPAIPHASLELGLSTTIFNAEGNIDKEFPKADKLKIKYKMDEKGRTEVGLISPRKPYYRLLTEVAGKSGEYRVLGESRRQTIANEIERLSEGILENKKIAEDTTKDKTERKKAHERAQMQISSRLDLQKQLDQLKTGEYTRDSGGQSIPFEVFKKTKKKGKKEKNNCDKNKKKEKKSLMMKTRPFQKKKKLEKKSKKSMKN